MKLKTYQATTMAEALSQVKRDLGRDAVIVRTRTVRKGGFLGFFGGQPMWEITASQNANLLNKAAGSYVPQGAPTEGKTAVAMAPAPGPQPAPQAAQPAPRAAAPAPQAAPRHDMSAEPVSAQVAEIRRMMESLLAMQSGTHGPMTSTDLKDIRLQLLRQEVTEEVVDELVRDLCLQLTGKELADPQMLRSKLMDLMVAKVILLDPAATPAPVGRPKVQAFIGPTGVGKTTTIAKLAANYKIREGKKVGMITIDTFRIAAVDQLKIYAEIIDVPLQVVLTAGELKAAIESMKDFDIILLDTAGRSQNDRIRIGQLSGFLKAAQPDEIHLVMAATANRSAIISTLERFLQLGVNRIIMTKLDEATACGAVLNVAAVGKLPISYVTTGQDVPDDIQPADPAHLARCIMEGSLYVSR